MGPPDLEDRTLLAAVERALASGDAVAQTDRAGTWTLEQAFERSLRLGGFLVDRLPYFMVPRYVEVADALPKTPTHKVQKNLLRDAGVGPTTWDRAGASGL